jgi:WD domain, G-beta repeat
MSTGREIARTDGWREPLTVSPDGRILASARSTITLREMATGGIVGQLPEGHRGPITCLAFAPDGKTLASGSADSTVLVWDWRPASGLVHEQQNVGEADLEEWWNDLASKQAPLGYQAIGGLAAAGNRAVAFLKDRLPPAAAKDWEPVRKWIADLDNDEFAVRERAVAELEKQGAELQPVLWQALQGKPSVEARRRLRDLLASPRLEPWAPASLRKIRVVQVLEEIGTPEARQLLRSLAGGLADDLLTQEASAALDRLGKRGSAP